MADARLAAEALARANLSDRTSFADAVAVVKTYARAKMNKTNSDAVGRPGGKLEALERKYGLHGYHDVFYVARLELKFPPSTVPLPAPSTSVRPLLEAAGFPYTATLNDSSLETGSSNVPEPFPATTSTPERPAPTHVAPSIKSSNSSIISATRPRAGSASTTNSGSKISARSALKVPGAILEPPMPVNAKKSLKAVGRAMAKPIFAGASAYSVGGECPVPTSRPPPYRAPTTTKSGKQAEKNELKRETTTDSKSTMQSAKSPDVPPRSQRTVSSTDVTPTPPRPESALLPMGAKYDDEKHAVRSSPDLPTIGDRRDSEGRTPSLTIAGNSSADETEAHLRDLFNALPPEAQALAYARLAEQREREAQRRAVKSEKDRELEREREREREARHERERRQRKEQEAMAEARRERERALERQQQRESRDLERARLEDALDEIQRELTHRTPRSAGSVSRRPPQRPLPIIATVGHREQSADGLEAQINQLLNASTLPPIPNISPRKNSPPKSTPSRSSTVSEPPSLISDWRSSYASSEAATPRLIPSTRLPGSFANSFPPDAHMTPATPHYANEPLPPPPPPRPVQETAKTVTGDEGVRTALMAKIRALQAALDSLDMPDNGDSSHLEAPKSAPAPATTPPLAFPMPPLSVPRQLSPNTTMRALPPGDGEDHVVSSGHSYHEPSEQHAQRDHLQRHSPQPRVAQRLPPLRHLSAGTGDEGQHRRSPAFDTDAATSSSGGHDDDYSMTKSPTETSTPPPEYATVGPMAAY